MSNGWASVYERLQAFVHAAAQKASPTFDTNLVRFKDQERECYGDPVIALEVVGVREEFRDARKVLNEDAGEYTIAGYSHTARFELQVQVETINQTRTPFALELAQKLQLAMRADDVQALLSADADQSIVMLTFVGALMYHKDRAPDHRPLSVWTFEVPFRAEFFLAETVPNPVQYTIEEVEGISTLDGTPTDWSTS